MSFSTLPCCGNSLLCMPTPPVCQEKSWCPNFRLRASAGIPTNASTHPRPDPRSLGRREGLACSTAQAGTAPYMLMADLGAEAIEIEVPNGPHADLPGTDSMAQPLGGIAEAYSSPGQPRCAPASCRWPTRPASCRTLGTGALVPRATSVAGRPYAGIALMMAARNCRSPTGLNSTVVG